jgi:hypothetical protein
MQRAISPSAASIAPHFSTLPLQGLDYQKKKNAGEKMCILIFSTTFM